MRVPGLLIANEKLLEDKELEKPLEQVRNVACLPGIIGYSIAMPDIHWGYGFAIGGVAAMDAYDGVISPGGVGYDINCGVRLAIVPLPFREISKDNQKKLLQTLFNRIPSGVGHGQSESSPPLTDSDYRDLSEKGAAWSIAQGYGFPEDLDHMESHGLIKEADIRCVSQEAKLRGRNQLGSIGSGNHFVEIGEVKELFLPDIAKAWGVEEGLTYILIHTGSRGFGHQVCQDTLNLFMKKGFAEGLPDKQLVSAPLRSDEGKDYLMAMGAAANFAFNNRQRVLQASREAFNQVLGVPLEQIRLIYDVCHNIAKFENHLIDGKERKLCVHRKGATRALGPNAHELSPLFKKTGQPVLVPGDMGRSSHLMVGSGNPMTWCSACHGAGRAKSRIQSMKNWKGKNVKDYMENHGILVMASSYRTVAEEMPDAYKDVDSVVEAVEEAGLAKRVAHLHPRLVIKG